MRTYIFFLMLISAHSDFLGMNNPGQHEQIQCENKPLWRPNTHELILQKRIIQTVKKDPQNPRKNLPASGPVSGLCVYNPSTKTEEFLEDSYSPPMVMKCSDKGKYLAATFLCLPTITESKYSCNPNQVKIWDLDTKKKISCFFTPQNSFVLSPNQTYIGCDAEDNASFIVRTILDGQIVCSIKKDLPAQVPNAIYCYAGSLESSVSFNKDDSLLAYEEGGTTHIVELTNPEQPPVLISGHYPQFGNNNLLAIFRGETLLIYDTNQSITDLQTGQTTFAICSSIKEEIFGRNHSKLKFDRNLKQILVHYSQIGFYLIPTTRSPTVSLSGIFAISSDFSRVATMDSYGRMLLQDVATGKTLYQAHHNLENASSFFSKDNNYFFIDTMHCLYIKHTQKGSAWVSSKCVGVPSICSSDSAYVLRRTGPTTAILINLQALSYSPS